MVEILKDYDLTIIYHLDRENELADSLSRKVRSMGSIAFFCVGATYVFGHPILI